MTPDPKVSRRDFLKLAARASLGLAAPRFLRESAFSRQSQDGRRNVLIVVFDAFSASNISFYGYPRQTTPNLARLADRAIVFHDHYAGSNFTTPGTATLLTGTLPWTHRAMEAKGTVAAPFVDRNLFGAFHDHYRIAYTHNGWANVLLDQMSSHLDEFVPWQDLFLKSYTRFIQALFKNDNDAASVGWTRNMNVGQQGYAYSLFLSHLYDLLQRGRDADLKKLFPRGLPTTGEVDNVFLLEDGVDWVAKRLARIPQPFTGYFHFLPPHGPYNTALRFYNHFRGDGFQPPAKPEDVFTDQLSPSLLLQRRMEYDEFILYVDEQFGRFFNALERSGLMDNTWVVFTSDHGEMNERGIGGHSTGAFYQPLLRIPLLIFEPGRRERLDIHTPTSAVDVLPTLLHLTGHPLPDWSSGVVLPPFAGADPDPDRGIYAVRAVKTPPGSPINAASTMLLKDPYKLLYYFGYEPQRIPTSIQLYDVRADPEELADLAGLHKDTASELLHELKTQIARVNEPYVKR